MDEPGTGPTPSQTSIAPPREVATGWKPRRSAAAGLAVTLAAGAVGFLIAFSARHGDGASTGPTRAAPLPSGYVLHADAVDGFALGLPSGWKEVPNSTNSPEVKFVAVDGTAPGPTRPAFVVVRVDRPTGVTLERFFEVSLAQLEAEGNRRILSHHTVQLVAGDSIELEFEETNDAGRTFHHFQYYLVHERYAFIFGFTDDPANIGIHSSTFTAIAGTFRFLS